MYSASTQGFQNFVQQNLKKVGLFSIIAIMVICYYVNKQKQNKHKDQDKSEYQKLNQDDENEPENENKDQNQMEIEVKEENQIKKSQTERSEYFVNSVENESLKEKQQIKESQKDEFPQELAQNTEDNKYNLLISQINQNESTQFQNNIQIIPQEVVINEQQIIQQKGKEEQAVVLDNIQEDKQISNLVLKLYSLSCNSRDIPEEYKNFLGLTGDSKELISHYGGQNQELIEKMLQNLQGFRRIRGDGNCFYTAFVVQYISLVLQYDQEHFDRFVEHLEQMNFEMQYINNFEIPIHERNQMAKEFSNQLKRLRLQNDRIAKFEEQIADTKNILYGLAIIFLRNLTKEFYKKDEEIKYFSEKDLTPDFLEWEQECNSNEIVLLLLSKHLELNVVVYYIDTQNNQFDIRRYSEEYIPKIYLIMAPGHYQIAIPKQEKGEGEGIIELASSYSQKEQYDSSKNFEIMDKNTKDADNYKQLDKVEEQQLESGSNEN